MKYKKNVLVYADRPGWAYDTVIKLFRENLSNEIDIYFDYCYCHLYYVKSFSFVEKLRRDIHRTLKNVVSVLRGHPLDYNYLLFFSHKMTPFWVKSFYYKKKLSERRVLPPWFKYDIIIYLDFYMDFYAKLCKKGKYKIKGIYTDGYPPTCLDLDILYTRVHKKSIESTISISEFFDRYFQKIDLLITGSQRIFDIYKNLPIEKMIIVGFLGEEMFKPSFFKTYFESQLVIGWTGNPSRAFKNFHSIIKPVVEELISEGYNIRFKTRFEGPYETLPTFYDDVHLVLIASTADAGPSLFAEASLSGVPSISTHIGYPAMLLNDGVNGLLVELNREFFKQGIIKLYNDRKLIKAFSERIREDYLRVFGKEIFLDSWRKALHLKSKGTLILHNENSGSKTIEVPS